MKGGSCRWPLGLVVGKFSPLHRGHEHLIQHALDRCERVLVIGYSQPEWPGCEIARRERWVALRFPHVCNIQLDDEAVRERCKALSVPWRAMPPNSADDDTHQDWLAWLVKHVLQEQPDAMFASEPYVEATCERLGRELGRVVSPIRVDVAREEIPVCATQIRADVHAHRWALAPDVYQDFVMRVAFVGGESTGKTTLAQALAKSTGAAWVPEYGRERWTECEGRLNLDDLVQIAQVQIEREQMLAKQTHRLLFCDTTPLTTLGYAQWMFGEQPDALVRMAQHRYDLIVLCDADFSFVQDGTRQGAAFRDQQQAWYREQLRLRSEPLLHVSGPLLSRMDQVLACLTGPNSH